MQPETETPRPTYVRYLVVVLAMLAAVLLYLDRFALSNFERLIKEDLSLSNDQAAWLLSGFFWTYALGQVPSGWLTDRFGARLMLALYILLWSLFTGLMGLALSFVALLMLRLGTGLSQAGAYPTCASLLSKWMPFSERGLASGLVSAGGRIGGIAAPLLTVALIAAFVPLSTSSLLTEDDLLDLPALCRALEKDDATPLGRLAATLRADLPYDSAYAVRQVAAAEPADRALLAAARTEVVAGLNAILQRPELYRKVNPADFALPPEKDEPIGQAQIERRNRLLLEAAFPGMIRQIRVQGWRPVMMVYGIVGIGVAGFFWLLVRDRPLEHPRCNTAERELIESGRPPGVASPYGPARRLPFRCILESRSMWLSSISQFFTNFGWVFVLTWLPRYLAEKHVPFEQRGWMVSLPVIVGMVGMLFGGWLTDRLTRSLGQRWGRALPMSLTRFTAMAAFLACVVLDSPGAVIAALCVVTLSTDLGTPAVWAFMQDVGGRHVGSVLGWGNMWGNVGAALSPVVLNKTIEWFGWEGSFLTCAAAFLLSGVAAFFIDATIPVAPADEAS